MADDRDGEAMDLGISLEKLAALVDQLRAMRIKEPTDADAEEDQDSEAGLVQETAEDTSFERLHAFISELNLDEQVSLVALAWTGRGDFDAEQWPEARRLAAERGAGTDTADYLLDMDLLPDLLAEGIGAFGLSIENIER